MDNKGRLGAVPNPNNPPPPLSHFHQTVHALVSGEEGDWRPPLLYANP